MESRLLLSAPSVNSRIAFLPLVRESSTAKLSERIKQSRAPGGSRRQEGFQGGPVVSCEGLKHTQAVAKREEADGILRLHRRDKLCDRVLHMRQNLGHAAGGVHKQCQSHGGRLRLKNVDRLRSPVFDHPELARLQATEIAPPLVRHRSVNLHQADPH